MVAAQDNEASVIGQARTQDARRMALRPRSMAAIISIECAAAAGLLWRLTVEARRAHPEAVERSEQRVHRFVGATFVALALYILAQAGWTLWTREAPGKSVVGIILAVASLVIMPLVAWGKLHAAQAIHSAALRAEAKETLACSSLSFTLMLGLVANAAAGWWWAAPLCLPGSPWASARLEQWESR
ncbi:MAG TPA: cation transporter [Candidatus Tectomicrobia bacterium]